MHIQYKIIFKKLFIEINLAFTLGSTIISTWKYIYISSEGNFNKTLQLATTVQ
jgi:hypothetical protein